MAPTMNINGVPTWWDEFGSGNECVVLLHGGFGDSDLLMGCFADLGKSYHVSAFDRRGHGRTPDSAEDFHYSSMVDETISFLEQTGGPADIVGYSDGGVIALNLAIRRPDLVKRIVLIGTHFHFAGLIPTDDFEADGLGMELIRAVYEVLSPDGVDHFPVYVEKTLRMFGTEPVLTVADIQNILHTTLVLVGDDDAIDLGHTIELFRSLPNGQLAVIPRASHLVPLEHTELCIRLIKDFLSGPDDAVTYMPIMRLSQKSELILNSGTPE